MLKNHDAFEKTTERIYTLANQLFTKATQLANSGQCNPDLIKQHSSTLEEAVNTFASGLDTRRETILQAQEVFKKMEQVYIPYVIKVQCQTTNMCLHTYVYIYIYAYKSLQV